MEIQDKVEKVKKLLYNFRRNKTIGTRNTRDCHDEAKGHDMMFISAIHSMNDGEPIQMSALAKHFDISAPAISQLARRLEKSGFVTRISKKEDRRSVYIQLTPQAIKVMENADVKINKMLSDLMEYLGSEDADNMVRILGKIDDYMKEKKGDNEC